MLERIDPAALRIRRPSHFSGTIIGEMPSARTSASGDAVLSSIPQLFTRS
jgi:hypothetical protein